MTGQRKKPSDAGVVSRLAGRGEDAITRIMDELGKNSRVTDALGKAMAAKGKVDERTRKTIGQVGLAPVDEVRELRTRLEKVERKLSQLERAATSRGRTQAGRRSTATRSTARQTSGTAKRGDGGRSGSTGASGSSATRPSPSGEGGTSPEGTSS